MIALLHGVIRANMLFHWWPDGGEGGQINRT
jgi:hypothetical protein